METENLLRQGIAAARAGQRLEARQTLMRVVKADQRNEQAWIWLAAVVDDPAHQRTCLEYALKLNPQNVQAQQGIAWIDTRYPPPASTLAPAPIPTVKSSSTPPAKPTSKLPDQPLPPAPQHPISVDKQLASNTLVVPSRAGHDTTDTVPQTAGSSPSLRHHDATPVGSGSLRSRIQSSRFDASPPHHAAPLYAPEQMAVTPPQAPAPADAPVAPRTSTHEPTLLPYQCPFCGAPTKPEARTCPQCSNTLYVRAALPERRSVALSFLGGVWGIISIFTIGVNFIWIGHDAKFILPLSGGIISLGIAVGLLRRYRWAYSTVLIITIGLSIVSVSHHFWPLMLPLFILLPRSYGDFYSKKQRFVPQLSKGSHQAHYEAGQAYRQQGMWYMASREWERAVVAQPENVTYSQALALAYARLHHYDKAVSLLQDLLKRRPDDARIQEIVRTIEDMASKHP